MSTFQFLRPNFLWLLLLLVMIYFLKKTSKNTKSSWEKVCDAPLLKYLLVFGVSKKEKWCSVWLYLGLFSAVFALAGPSFEERMEPIVKKQIPLMIVLDLSSDMNRTDIRPSRLYRAKMEIDDVLNSSMISPSGLIVYTNEPFLISPLAQDPMVIAHLLPAVNSNIMPIGGNRLDRALELATQRLKENEFKKGNILVLTHDVPLSFNKALEQASIASKNGFKVSVYALCLKQNEKLQQIAKQGLGKYFGVNDGQDLIDFLKTDSDSDFSKTEMMKSVPVDNGYVFVFVVAFCILCFFRKGMLVLFFVLLTSFQANAGFFFNNNQEGTLLFKAKEFKKAAEKFENTDWRAAAYYKAQDYEAAIDLLKNKKDVTSQYNLGNALAKSGRIPQAINVYEKVLQKEPSHADAKFNLEYLKKMMQNQSQDQNSENKKQENPQNQNEQNQNEQAQNGKDNQDMTSTPKEDQENKDNNDNKENEQDEQNQSGEETKEEPENQASDKNENENNLKNDKQNEEQKSQALPAKIQEQDNYDETVQAKVQKFREIKDDPGGLLKAFIKKEYLKNRYGD